MLEKEKLVYLLTPSKTWPSTWHVETIDSEGKCYVTIFSGPEAEKRASEYADWKNAIKQPASLVLVKT